MTLAFVGGSHHTVPMALRERLAFSADQAAEALRRFRERFPGREAVLLSTCNRVEFYAAGEHDAVPPATGQIVDFLAECRGIDAAILKPVLAGESDDAVARHLFSVASGLDSMVLGEPQIVAQVKQAWSLAQENNTAGPLTSEMFQAALRTAKRVTSETAIGRERLSIPSIAVADFARGVFERFDDKRVLLIGAGKMAGETLRYLREAGARDVVIVNRSAARAEDLAGRLGVRAARFSDLADELTRADLVVSTTGATEPVVTPELYCGIESRRGGRPLVVLDLAMPRDFDPRIGSRPGVWLYSIDDLGAACNANRKARQRELPAAVAIIEEETRRFMGDLHHRSSAPVIEQLRAGWTETGDVELERLFRRLPTLDDAARREIRQAFERYAAKLIHRPLASLRSESHSGPPHGLLDALRRLFDLKD
ncbi:MAG: glutamyl-tRNA reductase [Planctomycetota bacterium]|nr:MAG: glutamyl-tRNA reductase [Planctomycetota bacterium]